MGALCNFWNNLGTNIRYVVNSCTAVCHLDGLVLGAPCASLYTAHYTHYICITLHVYCVLCITLHVCQCTLCIEHCAVNSVHCTFNTEHHKYTLHWCRVHMMDFLWVAPCDHNSVTLATNFHWHFFNKLYCTLNTGHCVMDFLWVAPPCVITMVSQRQQCIASFQRWCRCHEVTNNIQIPIATRIQKCKTETLDIMEVELLQKENLLKTSTGVGEHHELWVRGHSHSSQVNDGMW